MRATAVVRSVHVIRCYRIVPHRTVLRDDHMIVVRITEHARTDGVRRVGDAARARERDKKRDRRGFHRLSEWTKRLRSCGARVCTDSKPMIGYDGPAAAADVDARCPSAEV